MKTILFLSLVLSFSAFSQAEPDCSQVISDVNAYHDSIVDTVEEAACSEKLNDGADVVISSLDSVLKLDAQFAASCSDQIWSELHEELGNGECSEELAREIGILTGGGSAGGAL